MGVGREEEDGVEATRGGRVNNPYGLAAGLFRCLLRRRGLD